MSLFGKNKGSYLGIDIGAHGIKLVELRKNKGRPQLWTYGIIDKSLDIHFPMIEDKKPEDLLKVHKIKENKNFLDNRIEDILKEDKRVEEYGQLLKLLIKEAKVTTKRATSSLPVSQVFHTVLNFPKVEEKELDQLVKVETNKMISQPIEEMQLIYQMIPPSANVKDKYTRVLVTAAPKKLIAFYTAIFQLAGLQLQELETEAFALSRSLVGHDRSVSMVVDMGAERTNFFIIDDTLPLTHRSLQIGGNNFDDIIADKLGLENSQIQQIKKDISFHGSKGLPIDLFVRVLEPIAKEIQYSFDLFLRQTGNEGKRPEKIILTGGAVFFPPVLEYIKSKFPMKVFIGDPWARVIYQDGLKQILDQIGPRMSVAIGLGLRNF